MQMVKKILHYMCDDKIYTHMLKTLPLRARGSTEPQEVAPTHARLVRAGAGEGVVWLIHHPNKQELIVLRQVQRP